MVVSGRPRSPVRLAQSAFTSVRGRACALQLAGRPPRFEPPSDCPLPLFVPPSAPGPAPDLRPPTSYAPSRARTVRGAQTGQGAGVAGSKKDTRTPHRRRLRRGEERPRPPPQPEARKGDPPLGAGTLDRPCGPPENVAKVDAELARAMRATSTSRHRPSPGDPEPVPRPHSYLLVFGEQT